jgi:hypothetical protein
VRTPGKVTAVLAIVLVPIVLAPAGASALTLGTLTTKSPDDVKARTVTLKAESTLSVLGASVAFQYGTTTRYGATSGSVMTSLVGVKETVTIPVSGLTPETEYHVRAVATSGLDTAYGRDITFKTAKAKAGDDGGTTATPGTAPPAPAPTGDDSKTPTPSTTPSGTDDDKTSTATTTDDDHPSASDLAADDHGVDPAAGVPTGSATKAVTPVLGKTLAIAAVQGTVTATSPDGAPVDLSAARGVPTGTVIDTRAGTVELTTALDDEGTKQTGRFWGGMFEVRQSATRSGLTQLVLRGADFRACHAGGSTVARSAATSSKQKKPTRTLWGSDSHGRFQTRGRGSVATVRGTRWVTQDTCSGTLTKVLAGAVAVRDFGADRTVVVRRGHQYKAPVAQ